MFGDSSPRCHFPTNAVCAHFAGRAPIAKSLRDPETPNYRQRAFGSPRVHQPGRGNGRSAGSSSGRTNRAVGIKLIETHPSLHQLVHVRRTCLLPRSRTNRHSPSHRPRLRVHWGDLRRWCSSRSLKRKQEEWPTRGCGDDWNACFLLVINPRNDRCLNDGRAPLYWVALLQSLCKEGLVWLEAKRHIGWHGSPLAASAAS